MLALEGAIVADFIQSRGTEDKQSWWEDRWRYTTSGSGSKLYILKCKNQTDEIFVNIKFLVLFCFRFLGGVDE